MGTYGDGELFFLALIKVSVSTIGLLREREGEELSAQTRIISMRRHPGREPGGAFGITRVAAAASPDGVWLHWKVREVGRNPQPRSIIAPCNRTVHVQFVDHLVFARAFTNEQEAKEWAQEHRSAPRSLAA